LEPGAFILVTNNIKVINKNHIKEIILANKKKKLQFNILAIFIQYTDAYKLHIKVSKSYKNILINNGEYLIESPLIKEVIELGYNYYL
jgi:hypothetical protein